MEEALRSTSVSRRQKVQSKMQIKAKFVLQFQTLCESKMSVKAYILVTIQNLESFIQSFKNRHWSFELIITDPF